MGIFSFLKSIFKAKPTIPHTPSSGAKLFLPEWVDTLEISLKESLPIFEQASDINTIFPDFLKLTEHSKISVLMKFFIELAYHESGFDPNSASVDVGTRNDRDTWSIGLLQMSVIDQQNLGLQWGLKYEDLIKPETNLSFGIAVMCNQIKKRGKIIIPRSEKGNPSVYWATLNPGNTYDKTSLILAVVHMVKVQYKTEENLPEKPKEQPQDKTPWLSVAKKELGTKEWIVGSNPRIEEYHSVTTLHATDDAVAWCSSFVSWCLQQSGMKHTSNAWARSYLTYGSKLSKPKEGAILVFSRGDGGHVGFYVGETENHYKVCGGNQLNAVSIANYSKDRLLAIRWPVS